MTNKRNQYTREFKSEAISLVVERKRKISDVASSLGVESVPAFVFAQKYLVNGAKGVENFKNTLAQVASQDTSRA